MPAPRPGGHGVRDADPAGFPPHDQVSARCVRILTVAELPDRHDVLRVQPSSLWHPQVDSYCHEVLQ